MHIQSHFYPIFLTYIIKAASFTVWRSTRRTYLSSVVYKPVAQSASFFCCAAEMFFSLFFIIFICYYSRYGLQNYSFLLN